ncbi:cyclin-dependent kinase regulatory subunit-domain-containing protein, partial [Radiomyces spectabilis]|uniref:cyclin-dependent kinase regulatory subunit-domain-containing protein n=1 Tax=Radiomyces spectabilis TaxID=64574 RepID=UPI00221EE824
KITDSLFYRHVILPKEISRWLPSMDCLEESEWRELGVTKMTGWEHYMVHAPEPHILLFRRARQRREKVSFELDLWYMKKEQGRSILTCIM